MAKDTGLESLIVWRKAMDLAVGVCREILPLLPDEEKYALATQLRRSVQSIPANIAEGYGRYYYQDNVRFCYIARGSLEETVSHLILANKLSYLANDILESSMQLTDELRRMLIWIHRLHQAQQARRKRTRFPKYTGRISYLQPARTVRIHRPTFSQQPVTQQPIT